jgi:hypothetical protein
MRVPYFLIVFGCIANSGVLAAPARPGVSAEQLNKYMFNEKGLRASMRPWEVAATTLGSAAVALLGSQVVRSEMDKSELKQQNENLKAEIKSLRPVPVPAPPTQVVTPNTQQPQQVPVPPGTSSAPLIVVPPAPPQQIPPTSQPGVALPTPPGLVGLSSQSQNAKLSQNIGTAAAAA